MWLLGCAKSLVHRTRRWRKEGSTLTRTCDSDQIENVYLIRDSTSKWDDEGKEIDENNVLDSLLTVKREKKRSNSYGSFGRFLRCVAWSAHVGPSDGDDSTPKSKETPCDMNTTKMSASKVFKSFKEAPKSVRLAGTHYQRQVTARRTCALCGGGVSSSYVQNLKVRAKGKRVHVGGRPIMGCATCAKAL
eukprot:Nk52_evm36s222 gene=Nk52_evmTU36s222